MVECGGWDRRDPRGGSSTASPRVTDVRISIVVPHQGDDVAFEDSLVSVLENRPADADICVVHDGSYSDPFDLGDEVQFLVADSARLPDLIAAAAESVTARVVHILGNGVKATAGWTETPLRLLSDDPVAIVAPVARDAHSGKITGAGWTDSRRRVLVPVGAGADKLSRRQMAAARGAYLGASFWRRTELRAAVRAVSWQDSVACEFAWSRLLTDAGWRCAVAEDSVVLADETALLAPAGFRRGQTLRSAVSELSGSGRLGGAVAAVALSLLTPNHLVRPGHVGELMGQCLAVVSPAKGLSPVRADQLHGPGELAQTLRMPLRSATEPAARKRAA